MGVKELLNLDWSDVRGMSRKDLGKVITQLSSAANKRIRRFREVGMTSPSISEERMFLERFSGKGKTLNELRSEYVRIKDFMQSETSTLRGWKKVINETYKTLNDLGVQIPKEDVPGVMKEYGKVKSEFPELMDSAIYAPVIQQIYDQMKQGIETPDIMNSARSMMIQGYENRERSNNEFNSGGVSDFF